jgi:hypothetical protein
MSKIGAIIGLLIGVTYFIIGIVQNIGESAFPENLLYTTCFILITVFGSFCIGVLIGGLVFGIFCFIGWTIEEIKKEKAKFS